ncbi:uncharacterized protein LOC116346549 [Contarinia nasturtii]|uniref:uncharacterized protein LOC116346549 n=1 Tax=Contarinia nasturtii TaxID=265458 RepID=UPI0012D4C304|nr:uncharacterized protein LOC116346549 [Contarinia nasturtii]
MYKSIIFFSCLITLILASKWVQKYSIKSVPTPDLNIADSPIWEAETQSVYFTDLFGTKMYHYSNCENKMYSVDFHPYSTPCFIFPVLNKRNLYGVGCNQSIFTIKWDGKSRHVKNLQKIFSVESNTNHLVNHAVADTLGNFFVGTFDANTCGTQDSHGLYKYSKNGKVKLIAKHFKVTTGLAFDPKVKTLLHLDGCTQTITEFSWCPKTGDLSNERVFMKLNFPKHMLPVGIAIGCTRYIYVSVYKGSVVLKINRKSKKIVDKIKLPSPYLTAPVFGGPYNNILFVTSSTVSNDILTGLPEFRNTTSPNGHLFKIIGLNDSSPPLYKPDLTKKNHCGTKCTDLSSSSSSSSS